MKIAEGTGLIQTTGKHIWGKLTQGGIAAHNAATASVILNDAVDAGMIAIEDASVGTRIRSYLPFWAKPG